MLAFYMMLPIKIIEKLFSLLIDISRLIYA